MKAFLKGLLFAAFGAVVTPLTNQLATGHLSGKSLAISAGLGALGMVGAYMHPNPTQQQGQ